MEPAAAAWRRWWRDGVRTVLGPRAKPTREKNGMAWPHRSDHVVVVLGLHNLATDAGGGVDCSSIAARRLAD